MSNKKVIIILSIFLISFFSTGLRAYSAGELIYSVSGNVTDNYGFKLDNVSVKATTENTAIGDKTTVTDSNGYYLITGLPDSSYNFSYTRNGFSTGYLNDVIINGADVINPDIKLSDIAPPVINGVMLSTNTPKTGDSIHVTVNATDNVAVTSVKANDVSLTPSSDIWSGDITAIEGTHSVDVSASDSAGHITWDNSTSYTATTPDTTPPTINITSPADGYAPTASSVAVIGTALDNIGLSKVEVKVGTGDWQPALGTNSWNAIVTLSEGPNTIYAQATDTSGNTQQTSITVTVVSAPSISDVRTLIISNSSIKVMWATNQSDLNIVRYGYKPGLEDGIWSSWNNNTGNPNIIIDGLTGQPVYYQVFSYNASNSSAYSNSSILNFVYPLQVTMYYIEPVIINNNESWRPTDTGHIGKFIGFDGYFKNTGEDSLTLSILGDNLCTEPCIITLAKNDNKSFMESLGRNGFEINSSGINGDVLNSTIQIKVMGQNSSGAFNYTNTTTISLQIIPIFKIKRAYDTKDNKEIGFESLVIVSEGGTTTIKYVLEANSSVNLTNVQICDPFYPKNQGGPCFNIPTRLEANKPENISYTYKATTSDLSSMKCEESIYFGIPCIINQVTFGADIESTDRHIKDTEYLRLLVGTIPPQTYTGGSGGSSGSSGGGGAPASSEDFNNIEAREVREMAVYAKSASTYLFKFADPVMVVGFESSSSENEVPVVVEVLKNRSKFIGEDAPGKPYKYFNVFVGTSGFSKKVSKGVIAYRVNNSWLKENNIDPADISLYKWRGTWVKLDTEVAENRSNYTYYASLTGNFSSFAIVAAKEQKIGGAYASVPDIPAAPEEQQNTTQAMANLSGDVQKHKIPGLSAAAILVFGIAGVIFYLKRNHKKFNRDVRK